MNENTTAPKFDLDICPFCGRLPELKQFGDNWAVLCSNEFCVAMITRKTAAGQLDFGPVDRRTAVAYWNSQRFYIHAQRNDFFYGFWRIGCALIVGSLFVRLILELFF
jgi:hypothetical protein